MTARRRTVRRLHVAASLGTGRARPSSPRAPGEVGYEWDILGGTLRWSPEVERVFGHPVAEGPWAMERWCRLIHPDDFAFVDASLVEALEGEDETWQAEYRLRCADGRHVDVLDRARIVRDAKGKAVRVVGALLDLRA